MVRMVVVGPVCQHQIGFERTDLANDQLTHFQRGLQCAIGVFPDVVGRADQGRCLQAFATAHAGQLRGLITMMARPAVRHGDHLDRVSVLAIDGGQASGMEFGVVRMRTRMRSRSGTSIMMR